MGLSEPIELWRTLIVSGRIVDVILGLMVVEIAIIAWLHRQDRSHLSPADAVVNSLAGVGLLFALRGALRGAHWTWIALALGGALVAHAADLVRRTRLPR